MVWLFSLIMSYLVLNMFVAILTPHCSMKAGRESGFRISPVFGPGLPHNRHFVNVFSVHGILPVSPSLNASLPHGQWKRALLLEKTRTVGVTGVLRMQPWFYSNAAGLSADCFFSVSTFIFQYSLLPLLPSAPSISGLELGAGANLDKAWPP